MGLNLSISRLGSVFNNILSPAVAQHFAGRHHPNSTDTALYTMEADDSVRGCRLAVVASLSLASMDARARRIGPVWMTHGGTRAINDATS